MYVFIVNGRSKIDEVGLIFEPNICEIMTLNNQNISLDKLKDMIHALFDLFPIQSVSIIAYRYLMEQLRYCKVILNNDKSVQTKITKHLRSHAETLELLVETLNLQLNLNTKVDTSHEIIPYDISF